MQDIVASVENVTFDIEIALEQQLGAVPLPFPGMDKSGAAVCIFYRRNMCIHGAACPYRHVRGDRAVVCKHWLRGLCKKGDDCEFLHEYDMTKMPECYFYQRHGECSNKECPFLHIDPESKIKDCPWYDRGFCRHGPNCKNRHVRRVLCLNYLCGFCPEGAQCKYQHPKYDLPSLDDMRKTRMHIVCHHCSEPGHKISQCPLLPEDSKLKMSIPTVGVAATSQVANTTQQATNSFQPRMYTPRMRFSTPFVHRNLQEVTCFKCGEKGHYANKCTKGHLAFLSQKAMNMPASEM